VSNKKVDDKLLNTIYRERISKKEGEKRAEEDFSNSYFCSVYDFLVKPAVPGSKRNTLSNPTDQLFDLL
jgi:hypothetical protein